MATSFISSSFFIISISLSSLFPLSLLLFSLSLYPFRSLVSLLLLSVLQGNQLGKLALGHQLEAHNHMLDILKEGVRVCLCMCAESKQGEVSDFL